MRRDGHGRRLGTSRAGLATGERARPSHRTIGYRPGLDGVRALAVVAVMLYHDDVSWARGGFVGVDVFFVLSGFLITSLLLSELDDTGRIDRIAFWGRRARRLLPALFLLLVGVVVYAIVWAKPDELHDIRLDGIATIFYVTNWRLVAGGLSYFQTFQVPSPLQHTWSLAIEEQYYLVWPIVLFAARPLWRRRPRALAPAIAALALASAALMAILFHAHASIDRLYYGTDTRAQALLVGSAIAAFQRVPRARAARRAAWLRTVCGAGGVLLLAAVVWRWNTPRFLYRGGFLVVALAAGALVVAAAERGWIARLLSLRPLPAIGLVSYGLYLWHWPVDLVLSTPHVAWHGFPLVAARSALTGALATASYVLVERPIRRHGLAALRGLPERIRGVAIASGVAGATAIALILSTTGAPSLALPSSLPATPPNANATRILMLGDSQMFTLGFWGADEFDRSKAQFEPGALLGCGIFDPDNDDGNCTDRASSWADDITQFDPDLSVLLVGAWETQDFTLDGHRYVHDTPAHEHALERVLTHSLSTLTRRGGHVALLEVPCYGETNAADPTRIARDDPRAVAEVNTAFRAVATRDPSEITFVPWANVICPRGHFVTRIHGVVVRPDGVHYRDTAGGAIAADAIIPKITRLADTAHAERRS
ncbi:MAG TPA: acyltransferase family protein [Acidimicrobiia bacterium]|jgi:peptidoglycan/LPS O-acetylase OafA/YrhL|nr:acyltransferase family protein [Acidimicrobiia bacterium]